MNDLPDHLRPNSDPIAHPDAIVLFPGLRVTVLSDRLLRIECSEADIFEDRASQVFLFRRQPVPVFSVSREGGVLELITAHLHLRYESNAGVADVQSLSIHLIRKDTMWRLGDSDPGNLLGTARTLDDIDGPVPLGEGLISRSGWSLVDDSNSLVFGADGWLKPRELGEDYRDLYFFGYGTDFRACIADFYRVSGKTPMLPRWALGNWWSRYWAYTQEELISLMETFKTNEVPLSVCVVDMDWHLVDVGDGIDGWTGYTWNRDLFPEPETFINWLHTVGLKTCLNLHPALGIRPHEIQYDDFSSRLGLDPSQREDIHFDIARLDFALPYLELLHHPHEDIGVDFWWIDWQQGEESSVSGLDPLWLLNHLHFHDISRDGRKRPLVLTRWGGLGSHRYPVGFSGDAHVTWESLAFQPYFTATAANVGYGWWSHDIGGHMRGVEDPELYTRWIQYGVFSPIFRIHSTNNPFLERRPWKFGAEILRISRNAMQLRHALIPYIYTMAWRNSEKGQPLVRPMYHDYPEMEEAYFCPRQYMFGDQLLAAPFVSPKDPDTGLSRQLIWLPPGGWYNFFTGEYFEGNSWHALYGWLDVIPLFARSGAIVPLGPMIGWGGIENPEEFDLHLFYGADGEFSLFEDNGEMLSYPDDEHCLTNFGLQSDEQELILKIEPDQGTDDICPANRIYRFHIHGIRSPRKVEAQINGVRKICEWIYDEEKECVVVEGFSLSPADQVRLAVSTSTGFLGQHRLRTRETCRNHLRAFALESETKRGIEWALDKIISNPEKLHSYMVNMASSQIKALMETITQAGMEQIDLYDRGEALLLWNNRQDENVSFAFSSENTKVWETSSRFHSDSGMVLRSQIIVAPAHWYLDIDYYHRYSARVRSD